MSTGRRRACVVCCTWVLGDMPCVHAVGPAQILDRADPTNTNVYVGNLSPSLSGEQQRCLRLRARAPLRGQFVSCCSGVVRGAWPALVPAGALTALAACLSGLDGGPAPTPPPRADAEVRRHFGAFGPIAEVKLYRKVRGLGCRLPCRGTRVPAGRTAPRRVRGDRPVTGLRPHAWLAPAPPRPAPLRPAAQGSYGFVRFKSHADAVRAIVGMNGQVCGLAAPACRLPAGQHWRALRVMPRCLVVSGACRPPHYQLRCAVSTPQALGGKVMKCSWGRHPNTPPSGVQTSLMLAAAAGLNPLAMGSAGEGGWLEAPPVWRAAGRA